MESKRPDMRRPIIISLLTEILGEDTDIGAISTSDAQRVKSILIRYPKNEERPATRGLALADALDCKGVQTINVQTINKYLQTYGTMFGWAKRNSYVSTNVFEGLAVRLGKKQQSKTARTAFSQNQVQSQSCKSYYTIPEGLFSSHTKSGDH